MLISSQVVSLVDDFSYLFRGMLVIPTSLDCIECGWSPRLVAELTHIRECMYTRMGESQAGGDGLDGVRAEMELLEGMAGPTPPAADQDGTGEQE
jgi:hypothetical protein